MSKELSAHIIQIIIDIAILPIMGALYIGAKGYSKDKNLDEKVKILFGFEMKKKKVIKISEYIGLIFILSVVLGIIYEIIEITKHIMG